MTKKKKASTHLINIAYIMLFETLSSKIFLPCMVWLKGAIKCYFGVGHSAGFNKKRGGGGGALDTDGVRLH